MAYRTSLVKRGRSTKAELQRLLEGAMAILASEPGQMSVRHMFYRLVSATLLEKTEAEYKRLCRLLAGWRRAGSIPWDSFVDSQRWHIGMPTYDSISDALLSAVSLYRKNAWSATGVYVEIWCEKDAIAGILKDVAEPFGVKVFPCRGFASLSSLSAAAGIFKAMETQRRRNQVYYFGDHDPSGVFIDRKARATMQEDFNVDVEFERVAVLPEQIEQFQLPTRPTKKSDSRAASFDGESVEIDAMPMAELRRMVEACITRHLAKGEWERLKLIEEKERASLAAALLNLPNGTDPFALGRILQSAADDFGLDAV
ncbi:MAG: hypothetical protein AMXMBFR7_36810 [Planctomycetota bacterium]